MRTPAASFMLLASAVALTACAGLPPDPPQAAHTLQPPPAPGLAASSRFPLVRLPPGFEIEKVAERLTYPTSITWDNQGRMYVAEAGGAFLEEPPPARSLRVEPGGRLTEIVNLTEKGIGASVAGLVCTTARSTSRTAPATGQAPCRASQWTAA